MTHLIALMSSLGTIMLIEDDPSDALFICRAFEKAGVQNPIQAIKDGDQALSYLEGIGDHQDRARYPLPVLILLDLKLPGMMGLQLLKWIRSKKDLRLTPVIVLTGSANDVDVRSAYEAGANSYLLKPANREDVFRVVSDIQRYWLDRNVSPPLVLRATTE